MCFSKPPQDNSAEIARQAEQARQGKITAGRAGIDKQFGQFNDPYFSKVAADYSGAYTPDLQEQFTAARKKLILGLSRSGNLNASAGASQIGNLEEAYQKNKVLIADRALSASNAARANVESTKQQLYGQLNTSADPSAAAQAAAAQAAALTAPPVYSPLGDLFSQFATQGANAIQAERVGYPGTRTGLFAPKSSAVVVS